MKKAQKTRQKVTALSARAAAAQALLQVLDKGQSLSALLPVYQSQVSTQDQSLLQELCFGVCRVLPRLEQIIRQLVDKPLKGKRRIVHCLLLVGLYQLLYTRVSPHAAVDEAVNAAEALKAGSFRGLINAVLRRFLRERDEILAVTDKHWQTLHPEWLVNKLKKAYPNWREIIEANNRKPPMWIRVNRQHCSTADYQALLTAHDISSQPAENPRALRLSRPVAVQNLPHFSEGWATVQDVHAQWSALLLEAQNGELILDACAAPGGKTTHILEQAAQAEVVALDIEPERLKRVAENLARLNQQAVLVCGDAARPDQWLTEIFGTSAVLFDRILLDAPCSATGVIRRHPDIKWLRQEADIAQLAQLQREILDALWAKLKPGGVLLYATCSVLPQENSEQIAGFLQRHADARPEALPFSRADQSESAVGFQFIPQIDGGDGFYYAKLRKL